LLALLVLLVIGLTGKYYIADEVSFVLMTSISKHSFLSLNLIDSGWCRNNDDSR